MRKLVPDFKMAVAEGRSDEEMVKWVDEHGKSRTPEEKQKWVEDSKKATLYNDPQKREFFIVSACKDALEKDLPAPVRDIVSRQSAEAKIAHDKIRNLRDAAANH